MEVKSAVKIAIEVYIANPDCDNETLEVALLQAGLFPDMARRMTEFLPLPFGREILSGDGVQFQPDYLRLDDQGRERFRGLLIDEPIYREALALVPAVAAQGRTVLSAFVGRSAEMDAINQALHSGSQLADLMMSSPIFAWEEGVPETAPQAAPLSAAPSKSWWPFGGKLKA